ncbi:4879_t:CDS:1 [Funneliformis geosporum]|uniref:11524_t:CDS:1 n=1 Tax=Funneliformis geosporum TaxID=1117311 RepID=A0A9W4SKU7_9GLOM|nr:4879_t:CDS:1 [Funneliformis geosporum]CAI2171995.1 11524_t:CDS:1 [Funneliformis geosporum]
MFIWLKYSLKLNDNVTVKPFIWSLFNWRPKEGQIPIAKQEVLLKQGIDQDELKLYINYHYKKFTCFMLIYISLAQILQSFAPDVSDIPYPIRVIKFYYDGTPFISLFVLLYCYIYACMICSSMTYLHEIFIIISAHLLSHIYSTPNSLLHTKLTTDQLDSLKLWLISFLFYSNPIYNHPYLSQSPKDLWHNRWHQLFRIFFVELGYKPTCHILSFAPIKLQRFFSILAAFTVSGILHEYILYCSNRYFTLEQLSYFWFNAIVLIIWELSINSKEEKTKGQEYLLKKIRNSLFMNIFAIFTIPWFIEPYIRCEHYNTAMHFVKKN